ncbi:MAG TPA: undecaprenyl-phosphate alpha-N-acetylglucosaminyl 1-phosphate transferase [Ruminiclostridium sp.]|nr:undecaprenyl/decaprenyl-phosphate alpha-N-acetylglucosaminyl 1-phosphate transferase [Candidatus Epulonipiscium sp.]HAA43461.1 undecaprenyl-phosphate alpha-N-acetylglucosaminyl 1-phosphate transferase [Ruminiclostridium sp.]
MQDKFLIYFIAFGMAFLISLLTTPLSKMIAFKVGAVDQPKARGMHDKPMPRMGGIAIFLGFIFTVLVVTPSVEAFEWKQISGLLVGGMIIFLLGFFDDIYNLNAKLKFLIQVIAALVVIYSDIRIEFVTWPFAEGNILILEKISIPITLFWIVGVTNAVNLIDGLDGLAAGVSSIAAICLMILSMFSPNPIGPVAAILMAALAGSCLGFLPYNFNPAKIFMGDTGSTFLGFVLAVSSIQGLIKGYTAVTILIAVLVLALPIFDTTFAILRRIISRRPIMEADRGHIHHRLVDKGYSQKQAVITLYGISGGFGIIGILLALKDTHMALGVFIAMGIALYMITRNK